MKTVRVYDLPTRVFHWSFAALFVGAYATANLVDDESARFAWHMLAGLVLGVAVLLRLAWGVVGTRHARWSDLSLHPRQLLGYLKGVVAGGGRRWVGHNPASSWAALSMVAMAIAMGASGLAMASGAAPEWVEEVHELIANLFLAVVLLHLTGLAVHALRYRDGLPLSMLGGRKRGMPDTEQAVPPRRMAAVVMLAVLAGTGVQLVRAYHPASGTLDLFGTQWVLGEDGGESRSGDGAAGNYGVANHGEDDEGDHD